MDRSEFAERFIAAMIALAAVSLLFGMMSVFLSPLGPLIAGYVFVRFRAGVRRRSVWSGGIASAVAVATMLVPVLLMAHFLVTATSPPSESQNFAQALLDFEGDGDDVRVAAIFYLVGVALAGIGGGLAARLHSRQLDGEYWLSEE